MKNICILGSTGSIGTQALDVIRSNRDKFDVSAVSCDSNIDLMKKQIDEFNVKYAVIFSEKHYKEYLKIYGKDKNIKILWGMEGLKEIVTLNEVDFVLTSVVGNVGLIPTYEAIMARKTIGLANKETLVTSGEILMPLAQKMGVDIIPVDSEHSAIYQCLLGNKKSQVKKIILTASGGPFRGMTRKQLIDVKASKALKHPNWTMGRKISIDSSTLMNKGLEVIEARWLFDVLEDKIEVVVHPQSIIHSMVEYIDNSIIAQLGAPDMRGPINYALNYPNRTILKGQSLNFGEIASLTFEKPDMDTFPCLSLAYEALKMGGTAPTVLNASNEVLVYKFLNDEIDFYDIPKFIEKHLYGHKVKINPSIDDILEIDKMIRKTINKEV